MKIDQEEIIAYILNELEPERHNRVADLIRTDEHWKTEFEKWSPVMNQLNNNKPEVIASHGVPDRYWNTFLPRVHERIDERAEKRSILYGRLLHAVPSFGLAVLILFFLNSLLITNKKIDYLLDQYSWMSNLNSSEIIDQYVRENMPSADDFISGLMESAEEKSAALADWDGSYSPTESLPDEMELTQAEQTELLENLEKTTTF
jgi:hypothetical protein